MAYFTLNVGSLNSKASGASQSSQSSSAISVSTNGSAVDAVAAAPIPQGAKSAKSSPPSISPAVASAVAAACSVPRSKSSPFAAAGFDWAAQLQADADSLAASINAASAVHCTSGPVMAAAPAAAAPPAAGKPGSWRSRISRAAGRKQAPASQPPLVPYLSTHTSVMLKALPNPLEDALESGLGSKDMPVLFLHGVGGLPAYLEMMLQVMALGHPLIVVQCTGVAMRLGSVSTADEVVATVVGILDRLGVEEACVIGHSYGEPGLTAELHCMVPGGA